MNGLMAHKLDEPWIRHVGLLPGQSQLPCGPIYHTDRAVSISADRSGYEDFCNLISIYIDLMKANRPLFRSFADDIFLGGCKGGKLLSRTPVQYTDFRVRAVQGHFLN